MLNSAQQLCRIVGELQVIQISALWLDKRSAKKLLYKWRKNWPSYAGTSSLTQTVQYYQVKVGLPGEWSIISWRLSSRPGLEPPELELEPATFRQALGLAFALRSANFMVGPPTVTPKLLTFFVKGLWLLIRTENMLDQVVVSILVRTCFVSVQKRNHHFDFTNFFACQHLFLIFTKLARILWLIFFRQNRMCKNCKMTPLK